MGFFSDLLDGARHFVGDVVDHGRAFVSDQFEAGLRHVVGAVEGIISQVHKHGLGDLANRFLPKQVKQGYEQTKALLDRPDRRPLFGRRLT